ncbi:hypothetical protein [Methylobacterium sp. 37f]|uniref:hypothetical protein n=1 Tax=Methylobacterium sp. 37f TaxID=2817058 RepID=UPI0007015F5C|nr:hypothetical protein [Methylobacterium sp. 37f]KQP77430.1 hypothetical protein ASF60_22985 [Methylobacterium sp. Leaf113]MCK2057150.1 hypothetical protein [Methylobacterium sp. 37f]
MASPKIPAATLDRLAKLLPHLASEHDGEVVATARAIGRTLTVAGLDWHDLAGAIQAPLLEATMSAAPKRSSSSAFRDIDPSASCSRPGMRLWDTQRVEPWSRAAGYTLTLDWTIPKAFGGRFLTKAERVRLKAFERSVRVTNADAVWIEEVVALAHKAAVTWRARGKAT